MAIQYNLVKSSTSNATQTGVQITSGVIVNELPSGPAEVQLDNAILQVGWKVGTDHPVFPQYKCTDVSGRAIGPNEVEITYAWEYRFPQVRYELSSSLQSVQTNLDKDGELITTTYTYPDEYKEQPELAGEEFTTSVLVDKLQSDTVLTVTRQEQITGLELLVKSWAYTGKINSDGWQLGISWPTKVWMCTGISGSSQDNGITYAVRYQFQYNSTGWTKDVVFVDPRTDEPPSDAEATTYDLYDEIDFNTLAIE